jgi:hypothetical protein
LFGSIVRKDNAKVQVAVGGVVLTRGLAEEIDALGVVTLHEPLDDLLNGLFPGHGTSIMAGPGPAVCPETDFI